MKKQSEAVWKQRRRRAFEIIEPGGVGDVPSKAYDIISTVILLVNLIGTVMYTFDRMMLQYGTILNVTESITVAFFAVDYILRIWTAHFIRPNLSEGKAVLKYAFSVTGIIDLLSFLPYYLPVFFPSGVAAFRMLRVIRIFRLFQINAYFNALNVITEVLSSKRQQLISSVFIILVLMLSSSLCMYSLEHEAQPEVFENAFSGIWWSVSTLLTIGYGDIYPITTMGKVFSIIITFLGVGMVAIPTGIISAGFVDQYTRFKRIGEYANEEEIHFIEIKLDKNDSWTGKTIMELELPRGVVIAMIRRGHENIVPRGDTILRNNDTIIVGAEALKDGKHIELKEVELQKYHPWNGQYIRDLDISRQTIIVMVKRNGTMLVPRGSLMLLESDQVILYSQEYISGAMTLPIG